MNELAFGNQVIQERGNNAHVKRMPEIEQFALEYRGEAETAQQYLNRQNEYFANQEG